MRVECRLHRPGRAAWRHKVSFAVILLVLLTGCATFDQRAGFSDLSAAVKDRSGMRLTWNLGTELDAKTDLLPDACDFWDAL